MAERKRKKEAPDTSKKGGERIRKEKLVKKRKARREKEKERQAKQGSAKVRKERPERKAKLASVENQAPMIYVQVFEDGRRYETHTSVKMEMRKAWQKPDPNEIRSIIPGSVLSLFVKEGDEIQKDQDLMAYEAMKMHNVIRAPFAGTVRQILVKPGDKLPKGALMMVLQPSESADPEPIPGELYFEDFE